MTSMTKGITGRLRDFGARLSAARTALGELHELDRELRAAHAAALKARERIAALPPGPEEIIANLARLIDEHAAHEAAEMAVSLRRAFGGEYEPKTDGRLIARKPTFPRWFYLPEDLTVTRLIVLCPELLKARFAEIIRAVPYEAGGPMADRPAALADADAKIAELEARHTELVDYAATLTPPVALTLLESVRQRRETERIKAEREARDRAAREKAAAAIEAAVPVRAVRSTYLADADRPPHV